MKLLAGLSCGHKSSCTLARSCLLAIPELHPAHPPPEADRRQSTPALPPCQPSQYLLDDHKLLRRVRPNDLRNGSVHAPSRPGFLLLNCVCFGDGGATATGPTHADIAAWSTQILWHVRSSCSSSILQISLRNRQGDGVRCEATHNSLKSSFEHARRRSIVKNKNYDMQATTNPQGRG